MVLKNKRCYQEWYKLQNPVSFSDQLEIQADIIPEGTIHLNEWISINDEIEGTFGVGLITISESISFEMDDWN